MRFLPVLLIVLALLPLSVALWCYQGGKDKTSSLNMKVECKAGINYCSTATHSDGVLKDCADADCTEVGCKTNPLGKECCCKEDFCNPAATPTLLLPLAAVAAMIAARI